MKSIFLRANRPTHLATSDYNFSVNVHGYIIFYYCGHRTEENTLQYKNLLPLTIYT